MKIQFEIKEKLPEIIAEIMHSDKWQTKILEKMHGLERITIKDPNYKSEACIEIWQHEIHIRTAWSNYTYRIFTRGNAVWCEYIGAYRGLLEQKLLPSLTPKMNILDSEVVESSLTGNKRQTLRTYSSENLKLKNFRRDNFKEEYNVTSPQDHPTVVYDEYIKEGMPMPSPYGDSLLCKTIHDLERTRTIGRTGIIAQINIIIPRHCCSDLIKNGKPPVTGVEDTNRTWY